MNVFGWMMFAIAISLLIVAVKLSPRSGYKRAYKIVLLAAIVGVAGILFIRSLPW